MFAASKTDSVSGGPPDSQFNYVTMLLHGDGTNGAQNNTFVDSSTNNFSITRNGNTTQGSFSPYGSNWSNTFSGGSYLTTPSNTDFTFGTGDFTIELWMNPSSSNQTSTLFSVKGTDYYTDRPILYQYNERVRLFWYSSGNVVTTDYLIVAGKWQHIAVTRSGSDVRIFYNGVLQQTTTNTTSLDSSTVTIGQSLDGNDWPYAGYISNLRVVKGTALYTSNFTPNTTPLTAVSGTSLLTCQGNRFVDVSASPKTITVGTGTPSVQRFNPFGTSTAYSTSVIGGSGYFDGSGDYLRRDTDSEELRFGTGNYTVEGWFNFSAMSSDALMGLVAMGDVDSSGTLPWFGFYNTGGWQLGIYQFGNIGSSSRVAFTPKFNQWYHLAFERISGTNYIYINGVQQSITNPTIHSSTNWQDSGGLRVGTIGASNYFFKGFISDVRIVKGTGVYTSNFTPNTAPLTAITNTQLLLGMTNGAIFDNAMMNDLETVGNAQISTSVKKYGTGSLAFDGSGDYLFGGNYLSATFGTGDFTIEMWLYYSSSAAGSDFLIDCRPAATNGAYPTIYADTGILYYFANSGNRITSSSISTDTWMHVAVCRSGTSTKMFINGTQAGSTYTDSTNYICRTDGPVIGADRNFGDSLLGYIDDFRITKGYARYTANFTAPTSAFSDTGPY